MKKGFTLVELSIVLVIIGLLIGGILVGQSLIESAKINAQVSQIQQFDAATITFVQKYKGLPGDNRAFGGDGNGVIEQAANRNHNFGDEIAAYWGQAISSEFSGSYGFIKVQTKGTNKNVPLSKMGKNGSFIIASGNGYTNSLVSTTSPENYYVIMDPAQGQISYGGLYRFYLSDLTYSPVRSADLMALDQKIDDGVPNAGNVRSGKIAGGSAGTPTAANANGPASNLSLVECSSGTTYTITSNEYACTPMIRIGAQTSNPL